MPNTASSNARSPALLLAALLAVLAIVLMLTYRPCGYRREGYQLVPPGAKQAEQRANRILNGYMDV